MSCCGGRRRVVGGKPQSKPVPGDKRPRDKDTVTNRKPRRQM